MRFHNYNKFLSSQLTFSDIQNILSEDEYNQLVNHFKDRSDEMIRPAIFEAEEDLNKEAHNMAMNSHVVCRQNETYDVIVYTCDGKLPYRKGNYFMKEGVGYLAYTGVINAEDYDMSNMKTLREVLTLSLIHI